MEKNGFSSLRVDEFLHGLHGLHAKRSRVTRFSTSDTIVAIATPPGRGGIGVVRLSGPDAPRIAQTLVARHDPFVPRHATLCAIVEAAMPSAAASATKTNVTATVDQVVVTWFAAHPQFGLWVVLLFLPLVAFILGSAALLRTWGDNPQLRDYTWRALSAIPAHWPAVFIGGATLLSAGVLTMITAHLMRE